MKKTIFGILAVFGIVVVVLVYRVYYVFSFNKQLEKISFDMEIKEQQAIEVAVGTAYYFVDKSLFADKDFAKKIVAVDPFSIVKLANELKNDKEVILAAVSKEGASLKYASDALKRDVEVVKVALNNWNNTIINPKGVIPADILEKIKN